MKSREPATDRAQATLEAAVALVVAVLCCALVVQVVMVTRARSVVGHLARVGARTAIVNPTIEAVRADVVSVSDLDPRRVQVSISPGVEPGDRVRVTVTYRCETDVVGVGPLIPDLTLTASLWAVVE